MATRRGTSRADQLTGTNANDVLLGLAGNDRLIGGLGSDRLDGGIGNDHLDGGGGSDTVYGGAGNDTLIFDANDRVVAGQSGHDTLVVAGAVDVVLGSRLSGIETIDLRGAGRASIHVTPADVIRLSDTDTLRIVANGDHVVIGGGWEFVDRRFGGYAGSFGDYYSYTSGGAQLQVWFGEPRFLNGTAFVDSSNNTFGHTQFVGERGLDHVALAADFIGSDGIDAGDFNHDGHIDLVFGTINTRFNSPDFDDGDSGSVYVVYGSSGGFAGRFALADLDGANGFRIDGFTGTRLGISTIGDINGDGADDLVIGVPGHGVSGRLYIRYGGADEPPATGDPGSFAPADTVTVVGPFLRSLGISVDIADFNGDGIADVLTATQTPEGVILFGKPGREIAPLIAIGEPVTGGRLFDASDGVRIIGFGASSPSLSTIRHGGDFNHDGIDDVLLGYRNAGVRRVAAVFGDATPGATINLASLDGSNGLIFTNPDSRDLLGRHMAGGGDFNGDGIDDLILAAPSDDAARLGSIYVVFGSAGPYGATFDLASLDGSNGFRVDGPETASRFGENVAFADFNGDGYADVVVGAAHADTRVDDHRGGSSLSRSLGGAAYIIFGGDGARTPVFDLAGIDGSNGLRFEGYNSIERFGYRLNTVGDLNGDGYEDLAVGAIGTDHNGIISILYGNHFGGRLQIQGGGGNDVLRGTAEVETFLGHGGHDDIDGGGGRDKLYGGAGNDLLHYDAGAAVIDGGPGSDTLRVWSGAVMALSDLLAAAVSSFEFIDLRGGSNTVLRVDADAIVALSETDVLRIIGDAGDVVLALDDAWMPYFSGTPQAGDYRLTSYRNFAGTRLELGGDVTFYAGQAPYYEHQLVSFNVVEASATGGTIRTGTTRADRMLGSNALETLRGGAGNDLLYGRNGADTLDGGTGNDRLYGEAGDDQLLGGVGNDLLYGAAGHDLLRGGSGTDQLYGGPGTDRLYGDAGNDLLVGDADNDLLVGGDGNDRVAGGAGNDTLHGGNGNDTLDGGPGIDLLRGEAGDDHLVHDPRDHLIDGGAGFDRLIVQGAGRTVAAGGGLAGIEFVDLSGSGPNQLVMSAQDVLEVSDAGVLRVLGGPDDLVYLSGGWTFTQTLVFDGRPYDEYQAAGALVRLAQGLGVALDEPGNPGVIGLTGSSGNDALYGGLIDEHLLGLDGDDFLDGAGGADVLLGGAGNDRLIYDPGDVAIDGGADSDTLVLGGGGIVLDLAAALVANLASIEALDLRGRAGNAVSLTAQDVLDLSDDDVLRIVGDPGDVVLAENQGWSAEPEPTVLDGVTYSGYTLDGARLLLDDGVIALVS